MEKTDQIALIALVTAVVAIGWSGYIVGVAQTDLDNMQQRVDHLEGSYDLLSVRYANQTAWLKAHGMEVPE